MIHENITYNIIKLCLKIHKKLGGGLPEKIYQRALTSELKQSKIKFETEKEILIYYNQELIGKRRVDFFIENKIILELKAVSQIRKIHIAQILNYIEMNNIKLGLLINFSPKKLHFNRLYNNKI